MYHQKETQRDRIEHLQNQESFSSDLYFSMKLICQRKSSKLVFILKPGTLLTEHLGGKEAWRPTHFS